MGHEEWDHADFTDGESQLGKRVPFGVVGVPGTVRLSDNRTMVEWQLQPVRFRRPQPSMFNGFLRLAKSSPEDIAKFARSWGILSAPGGKPCCYMSSKGSEAISTWRYFSVRATHVLNIAARLKDGRPGSDDDWRGLGVCDDVREDDVRRGLDLSKVHGLGMLQQPPKDQPRKRRLESEASSIAFEVNEWMTLGQVQLKLLDVSRDDWQLAVQYGREGFIGGFLFSAIALQLALTVGGAGGLYLCSGCRFLYIRDKDDKDPGRGRRNFCESCRDEGVDRKINDQLRRERMVKARELARRGLSVEQISQKVGSRLETISRWINGVERKENEQTRAE
jgi:hypothetical protein